MGTETLGNVILKFLKVPYMDIWGINEDGSENLEDLYLRRYYLYRGKRRPHCYLHFIRRSDYERACHDHPWDFTSIILKGGYTEFNESWSSWGDEFTPEYFTTSRWCSPGTIIRHDAEDLHRIKLDKPAWSLVFTGHRVRDWGFLTHDKGWINWKELGHYIRDLMPV